MKEDTKTKTASSGGNEGTTIWINPRNQILQGDALSVLKTISANSVDMVMTSPPYWALRDYDVEGQLGLEATPEQYVNRLCNIFDEVKRVLRPEGSCWVNLGDTYSNPNGCGSAGMPNDKRAKQKSKMGKEFMPIMKRHIDTPRKSLCLIPSLFAFEMVKRGWILRNELVWYKPNCMPDSCKDRFTRDFEMLYFFVKQPNYYFKQQLEDAKVGYRGTSFIPNSKHDKDAKCRTAATSASQNHRTDEFIKTRNKRCV